MEVYTNILTDKRFGSYGYISFTLIDLLMGLVPTWRLLILLSVIVPVSV